MVSRAYVAGFQPFGLFGCGFLGCIDIFHHCLARLAEVFA
jgi:hypothetical protein